MAIRLGINGMGRIGKVVLRVLQQHPEIHLVGINDLMDLETLAHLIRYDSTHGKFPGNVEIKDDTILINQESIRISSMRDPSDIPWKEWKADLVLESSGLFTDRASLQKHLNAGAKKVILSCPPKGQLDRTVVMGVNDHQISPDDRMISNASCTTNCLAPVVMLLEEQFGIEHAFMNTVHPFTNNQVIIDAPHKDLRRARTAGVNIIPTTTTAIEALFQVIPEMRGRFDGLAVRVPVHDGSLIEICAHLKSPVTPETVNKLFRDASYGKLGSILSYTEDPIVSSDIIGDPHSAIVDGLSTRILGDNFIQMIVWYDNESGYSNRIVDLIQKFAGA